MEKHKNISWLLSLFAMLLLYVGVALATPTQTGMFYFTTTPNIAHALDPENESTIFIFRWAVDHNGEGGQNLRIATSLNQSEKYTKPGVMSKLIQGSTIYFTDTGRNGVLYRFGSFDGDAEHFYLNLAMPGTKGYVQATIIAGFISNFKETGQPLKSSYYNGRDAYILAQNTYITSQKADLIRQATDFSNRLDAIHERIKNATIRQQQYVPPAENLEMKYENDVKLPRAMTLPRQAEHVIPTSKELLEEEQEYLADQKKILEAKRAKVLKQYDSLVAKQKAEEAKQPNPSDAK